MKSDEPDDSTGLVEVAGPGVGNEIRAIAGGAGARDTEGAGGGARGARLL